MADMPVEKPNTPPLLEKKDNQIRVTMENAPLLTVHYLAQIYGRLGYIVKLLEVKNG